MAAKSSTFNISVKLLTQQFNKGIKDIQKQIRGVGNFIKGAFALGSVVSFGKQMVQTAMDFEDGMAKVRAVSNATTEQMKMMADEARKLGATTRYTATEAAGALENLVRNGMSASEATKALAGTLQLAQANAIGLSEAANIVSNTLNMFGLSAKETTRVNDVLSATASNSATNISMLYEALVNAAPAARLLGISIEETSAAIGALAQRGVTGANAGTALRIALTKMINPKNVAKMQELGISIDENTIKTEGLIGAVKKLREANLSGTDAIAIFSERGAMLMQQLIGAYEEFEYMLEITKDSAGTTARMFEQGVGSTRAAIDTLKSTYEAFLESLGSRTSGVVNGAIGFLTKLIKNFETVGGTLLNIASVIVPLFTSRVVSMFTAFSAGAKKAAADAIAVKVAMGDWITIIATAVTWIGTYLYTAMSKTGAEIEKFKKQLEESDNTAEKLERHVNTLVSRLGPETDAKTLAGVTKELIRIFPDFTDAIKAASAEFANTHNLEKYKGVLEDILKLTNANSKISLLNNMADAYTETVKEGLKQTIKWYTGPSGFVVAYDAAASALKNAIKNSLLAGNEGAIDSLYAIIADKIDRGTPEEAFTALKDVLHDVGVELEDSMLRQLITTTRASETSKNLIATYERIDGILDDVDKRTNELEQATKLNLAKQKARTLNIAYDDDVTLETLEDLIEKEEKARERAKKAAEEDANKKKNLAKRLQDIDDDFNSSIKYALDDLEDGFITAAEYQSEYAKAVKKAYEDLRDATGASQEDNKYYRRRKDVENQESLKDAQDKYKNLKGKAETKETIKDIDRPAPGPMPEIDYSHYEFEDFIDSASEAIQVTDNFVYALQSIRNAFDTLADSDADWLDKLAAILQIMQSTIGAVKALDTVLTALGITQSAEVAAEVASAEVKKDIKRGEVTANSASAISGAASAMASIPYVGPILATAAATEMAGLLATLVPKFAKGGIIQGGSKYGDKLLARVNAGEAVLTQQQQKNFMDLANGKYNGGGQVQFYISGRDLVGVLRNNNAANSKISGAKGL